MIIVDLILLVVVVIVVVVVLLVVADQQVGLYHGEGATYTALLLGVVFQLCL